MAIKTRDGIGREFPSSYGLELNLLQVKRVDSGLDKKMAEYCYGASGVQNGMLTSLDSYRADGLRARRVTGVSIGFNVTDEGAVSGYYGQFAFDRPTRRYYPGRAGPL